MSKLVTRKTVYFSSKTHAGVKYNPTEEGAKKLVAEIEALPNYEKV